MRSPASVLKVAAGCLCVSGPAAQAADGQRVDLVNRQVFRVCSDPANLPFSNETGEGFENKIAELIAAELSTPIEYVWFPQVVGFIRQTLAAKRCDVVIGFAQGDDLALNTNHYYRSTYALVYRKNAGLDGVDVIADGRLKEKRIGIIAGTPPATIMNQVGLMQKAKPYPLTVDRRFESPAENMMADIRSDEIDAGILWGPIAGYFAARGGEALTVVPLVKEADGPRMAYRITFGVRHLEDDWKRRLNELIAKKQGDIDAILLRYGVPLLDEDTKLIVAPRK